MGAVGNRVRHPARRGRTDLAECRMVPSLVIEHLDVIEQGLFGVGVTLDDVGPKTDRAG